MNRRWWWISLLVLVLIVGTVIAQIVVVNLNAGKTFSWTAPITDATHGTPTSYNMKCGVTAGGPYTLSVSVAVPATSVLVSSVVTPGQYFCVVTALNTYGESGPSNEININTGYGPGSPLGLGIKP